jgi:hypothetical protein
MRYFTRGRGDVGFSLNAVLLSFDRHSPHYYK